MVSVIRTQVCQYINTARVQKIAGYNKLFLSEYSPDAKDDASEQHGAAPKASIHTVLEAVERYLLSASDDIGQYADDMPVRDPCLISDAVIAADIVFAVFDLDDTVQYIPTAVALIQRDIKPLQRQIGLFDDQEITRVYQRIHAVADVSIDQIALFLDHFLK